MPPFLVELLAKQGARLLFVGLALAIVVGCVWRYQYVATARTVAEAKVAELGAKVIAANNTVVEAKAINTRMQAALQAMSQANAQAVAKAARLEADAQAARHAIAARAAAADAEDTKRRARVDAPSPDEFNAVLRGVAGAM